MNRVAITFFYDDIGVVDEYMFVLVKALREFVNRNIFVSNGPLEPATKARLHELGAEVLERENVGFDVWAYKAGIEHLGYDSLGDYSELLLLNHTFYGPIFPFSEMFGAMEQRECDFWGITAHKKMVPNPFTNEGILPRHLNSHFIAVRSPMLQSAEFAQYWQTMPEINSYVESVLKHESKFTQHFADLGYKCEVYDDDEAYPSNYPCFINIDIAMERRCPILKRRIFFHDPVFAEQNAIDLPRALDIMRATSGYDEGLIWKNILRTSKLRDLSTNASLLKILPTDQVEVLSDAAKTLKIAVCAHIYYVELLDELMQYVDNISVRVDWIITTDSKIKKSEIASKFKGAGKAASLNVIVLEQNRGRDMSSLFLACRKFFLDDRYDLVLRLHTKKSPQVEAGRGNLFKRHLLDNLVGSKGLADGIVEMFCSKPWLGLVVPPVVHISFPTLGNAWFANKPKTIEMARVLGLEVKLDDSTPVAAYGTMFWFRPKALRRLFEHQWKWEDFNPEPHHVDGGLAHVLERLIGYVAQDAGFLTMQVLSEAQASRNYSMLEFKHERLASFMPWDFPWQMHMLGQWRMAGYAIAASESSDIGRPLPLSNLTGLEQDRSYQRVVVERMGAENDRVLHRIAGGSRLPTDGNSLARPDLRYQRELLLEKLADRCNAETGALSISTKWLYRSLPEVGLVNESLVALQDFSLASGDRARSAIERRVRDRHLLNYLFFDWRSGSELHSLFDSRYYAVRYLEAESAFNPMVHYMNSGAGRLFNPHPLFDSVYYVSQVFNRRVQNPLVDYLTLGWKEGLSPHPLFEPAYYLENNPDVAKHGVEPLSHYIVYGAKERRSPHWAFDTAFYLEKNTDVQLSGMNALVHFMLYGVNEGRWPNKTFDVDSYRDNFPQLKVSGENPLLHYVAEVRSRLREQQKVRS